MLYESSYELHIVYEISVCLCYISLAFLPGRSLDFFITSFSVIYTVSPSSVYPEPVTKMKNEWKLKEFAFFSLSQHGNTMYEGGNNIACGRATQALLRPTNCDFIPALYAHASSFKPLMSVSTTTVIPHSIRGTLGYHLFQKQSQPLGSDSALMTPHPFTASICTEVSSVGELVSAKDARSVTVLNLLPVLERRKHQEAFFPLCQNGS